MKLDTLTKSENSEIQKDIISKIKDLINFKNLEPGDKLPSERMLSDKFEVSRSNVRGAIQKLEFYGLLKSIPQSGTFVANIGVIAMNGMISDILRLDDSDFKSLVETRILLELKTARLAALRRTEDDLEQIKEAAQLGVLDGVTTNPSLIAKSGRNLLEVIKEICAVVEGPVSAEVAATDYEGHDSRALCVYRRAGAGGE